MRSIKFVLLLTVLTFSTTLWANDDEVVQLPGNFIVFTGETVPGIRTQVKLHWEYEGPTDGVSFHLTRYDNGISSTSVFKSTINDHLDLIQAGVDYNYALQAYQDDELLAERVISLSKTLSGGFKEFNARYGLDAAAQVPS